MHGHGEKPFLCTIQDCERSKPGNGFPRHWNLNDHMKRVHNISPSIHAARQTQPRPLRNKRHVHNTTPPDASSGDSRRVTPSEHRRQYSRHHSGPNEPLRRPGRPSYDVSEYDYDNARYRNPQGQEWREGLHNERLTGAESYTYKDTYAPPKKILSLAEKRFQDKGEELISMIKKVRHVEDKDALTSLRAAEDCLKVLTDEVMKTKTGPGWEVSRWDLERPD